MVTTEEVIEENRVDAMIGGMIDAAAVEITAEKDVTIAVTTDEMTEETIEEMTEEMTEETIEGEKIVETGEMIEEMIEEEAVAMIALPRFLSAI